MRGVGHVSSYREVKGVLSLNLVVAAVSWDCDENISDFLGADFPSK